MSSTEPRPLRVAVTGREGQVVRALLERGPASGVEVVACGRPALDLAEPASVRVLAELRPDVIVNAAAWTAVDRAEDEPDAAFRINERGAGAVAEWAARLDVPMIQLSTDYVFDGQAPHPYREEDATAPICVYGRSKLAGEAAVAATTRDHVILRTAWVYSPFGTNFLKTMLRLAGTRDEIRVVADQRGCPTEALDLADGILAVARNLAARPDSPELRGTFHIAGSGATSWAGFAEAIFAASAARAGPRAEVIPIPTRDFPTPARRPASSRLDCAKLARWHGVRLPPWQASLERCMGRMLDGVSS